MMKPIHSSKRIQVNALGRFESRCSLQMKLQDSRLKTQDSRLQSVQELNFLENAKVIKRL